MGFNATLLLKRIIRGIVSLWLAVTLLFLALRTIPGDAADALMGQQMSAEGAALLRHQLGLDQPLLVQYGSFIGGLLRGDLGLSMALQRPVSELLWQVAPFTAAVVIGALVIGAGVGIPLGIAAARRQNSWFDVAARTLSLDEVERPAPTASRC